MSRLTVPVGERDHAQGPADAAVTLVEYGDYECPHSKRAYPIVQETQRRLGGRLRFAFRHFPLTTLHPHAQQAAESAEAAGTQGKFWEMHAYLLSHQQVLADGHLLRYAAELGLDTDRFEREVAEHRYAGRVRADFEGGITSGVNGTPTFFLNGVRHEACGSGETLRAAVEAAGLRS